MTMRKGIATVLAVCALAAMALVFAGCGSPSPVGSWHFESMKPTDASMKDLSDEAKEERNADAKMLSVFMTDAGVKFSEDGKFEMMFLGDTYDGKWENADGGAKVTMSNEDYSSGAGVYKVRDGKLYFEASDSAGRLSGYEVVYAQGAPNPADNSMIVDTSSVESVDKTSSTSEMPSASAEAVSSASASSASAEAASSASASSASAS